MWGAESLTLLCPKDGGEEPYITIPELVQKVLHHRSYVNMQQRNRLGVAVHPATSLQIHALRARGSLDNSTGLRTCSGEGGTLIKKAENWAKSVALVE